MFELVSNYFGMLHYDLDDESEVYGWENISEDRAARSVTMLHDCMYGYVHTGSIKVSCQDSTVTVNEGFWFMATGVIKIEFNSDKYRIAAWTKRKEQGMLKIAKLESQGRLKYIDGAYDTILHSPFVFGMSCLNALFMPLGVNQTAHTHPSLRSGMIVKGGATCEANDESYLLEDGQIFILPKDVVHKFRSDLDNSKEMVLVAYHPDSDFGPKDEFHPMLNRTVVDGVSANSIDDIRTS